MSEEPIRSRQNQWIKRVRRAIDRHDDVIVIEGPKMIGDAIGGGWVPLVILEDETRPRFDPSSVLVEHTLFRELASTRTSQGVMALFERPEDSIESLFANQPRRIVVLDSVQDPGNVGAIIRSAAAFGLSGVVCLPGSADPWSPKSIRASAGAVLILPLARASTETVLDAIREHDIAVYMADPRAADTSISRNDNFLMVFGSEGRGVSPELAGRATGIRIPMSEEVESLNVAAAAAIILSRLYEARPDPTAIG